MLKPGRKISRWYYVGPGFAVIVIVIIVLVIWLVTRQPSGTLPYPIPRSEAKQLGFDIYYPSQKLLPSGYSLNKSSFEATNQVLIYSVSYGNGHKIVFSDQAKPTSTQIEAFYTRNLPLNTTLQTNIGLATMGAISDENVVSIPTNTNAWLIVTAPSDINQGSLDQVIKSVEIAR